MTRTRSHAVFTCLLLLVGAAIGVDAYRIGFFADDFHFLDVARRLPLSQTLLGQDGIWPWFRPLSRELYFKLIVATGPMSIVAAHTLNLACVFACAWLLWRIAHRLFGAQVAGVAAALFVSHGLTKFLTAWASGMQDLLGLLLALLALDAYLRGRHSQALVWAFLAPFAKETGFLVFPLLIACSYFCSDRRPSAAWLIRLAAAGGVATFVHVLARLSWESGGTIPRSELAPERLPSVLGQMLAAFVGSGPAVGAPWLAIISGAAAAALLTFASSGALESIQQGGNPPPARGIAFASTAALMGIAPVVAGHLMDLTTAHAYQMFPASPWIAVLLARLVTALPVPVWRTAIPILVAWNVWASGYGPPNLEDPDAWRFAGWNWREAVRFSAVSDRLRDDVREQLAVRPESLVVLYEEMPPSCYFQTEDGPATREALHDRSVRTYWINDPPRDISSSRLAILTFDTGRYHLQREHWSNTTAVRRGMNAIMAGRGNAAIAFALYGAGPDSAVFDRAYIRAAGALLEEGPAAFVSVLATAGMADTVGAAADSIAQPIAARDPLLGLAFATVLHRPRSASAHVALADSLLRRGVVARAACELRIAVTLDPSRLRDRYRLALVLGELGGTVEAMAELKDLLRAPSIGPLAEDVHAAIAQLKLAANPSE